VVLDLAEMQVKNGFLMVDIEQDEFSSIAQGEQFDANFRVNRVAVNLLDVVAGFDLLIWSLRVENKRKVSVDRQ